MNTMSEHEKQQLALMQRWLQHAPPPPERKDNEYDVFISYRSSDRGWALALYDVFKMAGWEPFLDQFELVAGSTLSSSLEDALFASSSGVVLWSSRTRNSDWCRKERDAMNTLKADRKDFAFVFLQLDNEKLPLFARSSLYVDFSESPEGPHGAGLLRLLYGLKELPLPSDAVKLAEEIDGAVRALMLKIAAAVEAENSQRLIELTGSDQPGLFASPGPILAAATGLISLGDSNAALDVLAGAQIVFPKSIEIVQKRGLALRRLGKYQEAIDELSTLYAAGHRDPETMGILGAAWDGRFQESGRQLHLRKSRDLYLTAFTADPQSYYTGINAATKSLYLGDLVHAQEIAGKVQALVSSAEDGNDFWAALTLAEACLLSRDLATAAMVYQRVIDKHAAKLGDLRSATHQAMRICEVLALTAAETQAALEPFELLEPSPA